MENNNKSQLSFALQQGTILGLIFVILSLAFYLLNMQFSKMASPINYLVTIIFLVIALKSFRDNHLGGYISYGKALGTGTLITLFAGIVSTVYFFIFIKFIDNNFIAKIIEKSQQEMLDKGMPDDQIEKAMAMQQWFMNPVFLGLMALLGITFMGFLFSLVISAFIKRNNDSFEGAMANAGE